MTHADELNALALSAAIDDLREQYDTRMAFLENRVATLYDVVAGMQQSTGEVLAAVMGRGSTVKE